jgi:ribose transport system permease protein
VDVSTRRRFWWTQRRILGFEACVAAALLILWRLALPAGFSAIDVQVFILTITPLAIASMAQTFPIVAGGQGLSAGATLFLVTSVVATRPMTLWYDAVIAIAAGLGVGATIGAVNGCLVGFLGLRSTVATLAVGAASMSFGLQHSGEGFAGAPEALQQMLLGTRAAGISIVPLIAVASVCVVGMAIQRTRFGHAMRLVGAGVQLAQRRWLLFWAYVLAGVGASIGGVFLAAETGSVDAAMGAPLLLQILAAIALGGSAPGLRGGSVFGSLLGALIVASVGNLFIPFDVPDFLSNALDASWLLIGFLLCVFARRGRAPELAKHAALATSRPLLINLALLSPLALLAFNARSAASDLTTLAAGIALLAVGQAAVLRIGTIDLSMPGLTFLSSMAVVSLTQYSDARIPYVLAGLAALAVGVGFAHTWLATKLGRAAIAATLATGGVAQSVAAGFLVLLPTGYAPPAVLSWTTDRWFGLSPAAWLMSALAIATVLVLDRNGNRSLGFFASALASVTFGVVLASLGGSVHFSIVDTYALPVFAAALLTSPGLRRPSASLAPAIPIAYSVVVVDTALLGENVSYAGRALVLALAMICGEALRVALERNKGSIWLRPRLSVE